MPLNIRIGDLCKNWWPNQDWQILWNSPRLRTFFYLYQMVCNSDSYYWNFINFKAIYGFVRVWTFSWWAKSFQWCSHLVEPWLHLLLVTGLFKSGTYYQATVIVFWWVIQEWWGLFVGWQQEQKSTQDQMTTYGTSKSKHAQWSFLYALNRWLLLQPHQIFF